MYRLPPGPWSIPLIGNFEGRILTNVKQVHTIISPIYHSGFSDMTTYIDNGVPYMSIHQYIKLHLTQIKR